MKMEHIHPCKFPKCTMSATVRARLENGRVVGEACDKHRNWLKELATQVEQS